MTEKRKVFIHLPTTIDETVIDRTYSKGSSISMAEKRLRDEIATINQ